MDVFGIRKRLVEQVQRDRIILDNALEEWNVRADTVQRWRPIRIIESSECYYRFLPIVRIR